MTGGLGGQQTEHPSAPLEAAKLAIHTEAAAVARLVERIDIHFESAVNLVDSIRGRVVVTGLGKSGVVGRKLASTLASLGTPAFFVHAAEAMHGDAGMLQADDVLFALSNSGETEEVCCFGLIAKTQGVPVIALTGCRRRSTLARLADVHLDVSVEREADHLNLAPTTSTTAAMAMSDALAVALAVRHEFSNEEFARTHPAGALGRRLSPTAPYA